MVAVADVRRVALSLPGTTEHLIRDRVKFRVKRLVYVAFPRDETLMGFGSPKEQRPALVESEPHKFLLPPVADMRYNWVDVRMAVLDIEEMTVGAAQPAGRRRSGGPGLLGTPSSGATHVARLHQRGAYLHAPQP